MGVDVFFIFLAHVARRTGLGVTGSLDLVRTTLETVVSWTIEEGGDFLQRKWTVRATRLQDEEVAVPELECQEDTEYDIVFPVNGVEGDWVDVLVEHQGGRNTELEDHDALGADTVWENLDGVRDDEWRHGNVCC